MNKEKFKQTIVELQEVVKELKLKISDEALLENARALFISGNIQEEHKGYKSNPEPRREMTNPSDPATEKQKTYLATFGIKPPAGVTKLEISKMIDEQKKKRDSLGENDEEYYL